jgi:hypothetical protein
LNLKFLNELAATAAGTSSSPHWAPLRVGAVLPAMQQVEYYNKTVP